METKLVTHTPGNWSIDLDNGAPRIVTDTEDEFCDGDLIVILSSHYSGRTMANAHLIAAAPELLELLTAFVDRFAGDDGLDLAMTMSLDSIVVESRVVIAKATGKDGQ
jgi:hypothetical protein